MSNGIKNKTVRKKPIRKERVLFILFCITFPIIDWLIFYIYANLSSFTMAFTNMEGQLSVDNFVRFYHEITNSDSTIWLAFRNTFLTFGIGLLLFPLHVLVPYFIYKKIPGATIYRILFFLPGILFSVCTSMVFMRIVGVNGFIAQWVGEKMNLGYVPELLADSRFANTVVLLHMIWMGFPGDLIIWGGTFARIPTETLEAGRVDGTNWWTEFTRIVVPMVWPTVALKLVLSFCGLFSASGAVFLLTGGQYGTMTFSAWMYITLLEGSSAGYHSNVYNYMSAVGMCTSIVAITISLNIRKLADKYFTEVEF